MKKRRKQRAKLLDIDQSMVLAAASPPIVIAASEPVEIEAAEGDSLPAFRMIAYTGGTMVPRGFTAAKPVVVDLSGLTIGAGSRPILLGHDPSKIVGHASSIRVEGSQIVADGVISGAGTAAQEVITSARNGFPWRASIGASVERMEEIQSGAQAYVNGRTFTGPLLVARAATLGEISFVSIAADDATSVAVAADSTPEAFAMTFENWLQAQGFAADDLTDTQTATLRAAYDQSQEPETVVTPTVDLTASREQVAAEAERVAGIQRICAAAGSATIEHNGEQVDLAAHAIRNGWTTDATELHILRASRAAAPAIHSRDRETSCSLEAMQAASLIQAGVALDSPRFRTLQAQALGIPSFLQRDINDDARQRHMEAAHRLSDMSALDICAEAIRLDGRQVPSGRNGRIEAAFSGSALTKIFTTSVNAVLLESYMQSQDTTMGWVREADVPDFKTNDRIRMDKGGGLAKLPRGQEADHYDRSDAQESYRIARYAKQFVVDEQDIIDDNLGALRQMPQEMGAAAARLRPDLVYYIVLASPNLQDGVALFNAASHSNLNTSAALTSATLAAAIAALEKQQDNGVNLNLRASHVIVPSDLKHTAAALIRSASLITGASATVPSENTLATVEQLQLVSDSRLANGVTDPDSGTAASGSSTTWYIASAMAHTIEVGYLRGSGRAPQVRSFTLEQGKWGLGWDVKMDIGAKALDYRGFQKNTA